MKGGLSVLLRHHGRELSSSQKNASHFEKVLMSEPLSKPSTGPSIQSLYMEIDSHSCAFFLAVTRIIHRPHEKGNQPCRFPRPASDTLCLSASCCSCTARLNLSGHPSSIYLSSSQKNMSQNEQDLTSEPMSKPSTGPSIQGLCMKIDFHLIAAAFAQTSTSR